MTHEPLNRSPRKNWVENAGQLPAYVQHIALDIHQQKGVPLSVAIPTAIAAVKRWAAGGGNVNADTRAKAAAAVAEWEKLKASSHAKSAARNLAEPVLSTGDVTLDLAFTEQLHPRVQKGATGGGRFTAKQGGGQGGKSAGSGGSSLPPDIAAQVRDFQRRHGLPVTGTFDAATTKALHYHASGQAGKAAGASKRHAKAVLSARKKAAKARAAAARRAARAKTSAAKKQEAATVSAVNKLSPAQRKAYRARVPTPPAGYAWSKDNRLVTASSAGASQQVGKVLGLTAPTVATYDLAADPAAALNGVADLAAHTARSKTFRLPPAGKRNFYGPLLNRRSTQHPIVAKVNRMPPHQRRAVRRRMPKPPSGHAWTRRNKLRPLLGGSMLNRRTVGGPIVRSYSTGPAQSVDLATDPAKLGVAARKALQRKGAAMAPASPGGQPRFPIRNRGDLAKAIHAVGRAKGDHGKVRAHIVKRARALGATDMIPAGWKS